MVPVTIELIGDRRVTLRFTEFPQRAHDRLLERITSITEELEAAVVANEPNRTGALRRSTQAAVYDQPNRIAGYVSIRADFGKAAALEYGAHASTKVSAHTMRLDHVFAEKLAAPLSVVVAQHERTVNIAEHAFLRGALGPRQADIQAQLAAAIVEAETEAA